MRYYPRSDLDTTGKCDKCIHYHPVRKLDKRGILTEFARGRCMITEKYKQRTETCKKYKSVRDTNINEVVIEAVKIFRDYPSMTIWDAIEKAKEVIK